MGPRRRLLRWANWFALVNVALLAAVGLRYLWYYSPLEPVVGWIYAVIAFSGQMSALAYAPLLALVPLMLLVPLPQVILPVTVFLSGTALSLMLLDTLVFAENRYHLSILTASLLAPGTWAFLAFSFLIGLVVEAMLAGWVWKRTAHPTPRAGWYIALGLGGCILASHAIHAWAEAHYYAPITGFTRYLPLYNPRSDRGLVRLGLVDRTRAREGSVASSQGWPQDQALNYPLAPLRCEPPRPLLNVLLVVIDAMRADALTPEITPRMNTFAAGALRFDTHYSGGNSSRAGMFSLFYGVPGTYWDAFGSLERPPVLMDLFRQYGYELGLFASAPVYRTVALDRTALARVPNLRLETVTPYPGSSGWDRAITEEWFQWLDKRDASKPFFGFLYYDAPVSIEPPEGAPSIVPFPPGATAQVRKKARYLTAVHYNDLLLGRVLDDLQRRELLERTVVVITSDHGMEFDENGLGFAGHGTAFSELQMHTPLVIYWPDRLPVRISRRTSHNDIAPTLLAGVFGCTNPPSDYSSGHSLFSGSQWDWLVAASYVDYALIEPERVTVVFPSGYEIRDRSYSLAPHPMLPRDVVREAMKEMGRFYR